VRRLNHQTPHDLVVVTLDGRRIPRRDVSVATDLITTGGRDLVLRVVPRAA
jgi:hypothetical protein